MPGTLCQIAGDTDKIDVGCIYLFHQSADDVGPADSTEVNIRYVGYSECHFSQLQFYGEAAPF